VDLVIIMLGTNDTKRDYGVTAPEIAGGASVLVHTARASLSGPGPDATPPRVLLVAPVPLGERTLHADLWGFGDARDESRRLADLYRLVAEDHGVGFFDAGSVATVSTLDGVHLDAAAHAALGAGLADAVRAEFARG
jgi:lysophospholipase L1-like esterase